MQNLIVDIETTSLDPFEGRIIAIGLLCDETKIFTAENERKILKDFWEHMRKIKGKDSRLVGYNIENFDWHFLKVRSLYHNVRIVHFDRYKEIFDIMTFLSSRSNGWKKLDEWCKLLSIDGKFELNGSVVPALWQNGDIEKIKEHLKDDLEKTNSLFQKLVNCGMA